MSSLLFQAIDWKDFNEYSDNTLQYIIRIFGRTLSNESICVKVLNYNPHFYIEVPDDWKHDMATKLKNTLLKLNKNYRDSIVYYDLVKKYKYKGFSNNKKFNFLRILFNNSYALHSFVKTLHQPILLPEYKESIKFSIYESNIDTILRCMHNRGVLPCGWILIKKFNIELQDDVTCDISINCDWTNLYSNENQDLIPAAFKICSFDIECTSGDGSFPQPNRLEDKIIQIGSVFSRYTGDIYRKHIITLDTCDNIDDCEVVSVSSERDLLLEWTKLIQQEDPDFLTGYNIWGFDEYYMYNRSIHENINCSVLFSKFSKLKNHNCKYVTKELSSAALGDNLLKYYDSIGRLQIDLMKIIQRDYKLNSYKLDFVAETFIQNKITSYEIISEYTLKIISDNLHLLRINNYIKLINNAELNYGLAENDINYNDIKYRISELTENYMIVSSVKEHNIINLNADLTWGLVKDDIHPNDIFKFQTEDSSKRKIIAEYCIQDCVLVIKIMAKLDIITSHISMANVCTVPFNYLLIRGQGIKSLSLVSKKCKQKEYLIPLLVKEDTLDITYEGATVFEPITGFYQTYVVVLDYNSLYPNSIISKNISHETIVLDDKYLSLPDCSYYTIKNTGCTFAKYKNEYGILPEILNDLLQERKAVKKLMISEIDSFKKSILNSKQNALKITANSLYGQLGSSVSPIYMKELASSTTAIGREMLELAKYFVENEFTKILHQYYTAYKSNDESSLDLLNKDYNSSTCEFIKSTVIDICDNYIISPKIIYGDSCTGDMPIMIKSNSDNVYIITIKDFYYLQTRLTHNIFQIWSHVGWTKIKRVIKHYTTKKIYRVMTSNHSLVDVTEDHSLLTSNLIEIKPQDCNQDTRLYHSFPSILNNVQCINESLFVVLQFNYIKNIANNSVLHSLKYNNTIVLLHNQYNNYVYDIETECGSFHAGIGSLIIKNTDSIFTTMNLSNKITNTKVNDKSYLEYGIKLGQLVSIFIKKVVPYPHNLEYEKTFYPFCLMSKKRYVGNKYELNPNKFKQESMGIVLKRRDNANIVKKIIGGLINIILNVNDIDQAIQYMRNCIENLLNNKYPITDLITTKTLRASYKGIKLTTDEHGAKGTEGTWKWYDVECSQAHVKLCQRMMLRDKGNVPAINDRIPLVATYIKKKKGVKLLQGDTLEHPDYIIAKKIKIDYLYYLTNQIMNPAIQFLEHLTNNPSSIFDEFIIKENMAREENIPLTNIVITSETASSSSNGFDQLDDIANNLNTLLINTKKGKRIPKHQMIITGI